MKDSGEFAADAPSRWMKKPVVVEAIQYRPDLCNCEQVAAFIGVPFEPCDTDDHDAVVWHIDTLEGCMEASPGDWIIRGVQGEHYPCKPDIFKATYSKVGAHDA